MQDCPHSLTVLLLTVGLSAPRSQLPVGTTLLRPSILCAGRDPPVAVLQLKTVKTDASPMVVVLCHTMVLQAKPLYGACILEHDQDGCVS